MQQPSLLFIGGPTASGKSALAMTIAKAWQAEIICADSRQIYRGLDIGTAKPTAEEQARIRHHMIDIVDPGQTFNAKRYADTVDTILSQSPSGRFVVVGGTGLYLKALIWGFTDLPQADLPFRHQCEAIISKQGISALHQQLQKVDPESAKNIHENDPVRTIRALEIFHITGRTKSAWAAEHGFKNRRYVGHYLILNPERQTLYNRINARVDRMFNDGLVNEIERLLKCGCNFSQPGLQTIGYQQMQAFFQGSQNLESVAEIIKTQTRRYAKRQIVWNKKVEGADFIENDSHDRIVEKVLTLIGSPEE